MAFPSEPTAAGRGDFATGALERLWTGLAGRYAIERELSRGGAAIAFLARDVEHERQVALNVIQPELGSVVGAKSFLHGMQLVAKLQHPCLVPVQDYGAVDGLLYYVTPYIEGESLRARLRREGQLPLDDALLITQHVASALGYAHGCGIVHRDIKPENILLSGERALVLNIGLAQALFGEGPRAAAGERLAENGLVGTPAYMSPEQASGSRVDRRSDLYSLGCMLYEILGGEPPYTGPSRQAILAKQVKQPIPQLRALREEIPPSVEQAVTRALAKSPADRFASAEQFAAALAPGTIVPTAKLARWRARRIPVVVAALALVVAGAAGIPALFRHRAPVAPPATSEGARRIVVAVFANHTGDPLLNPLGEIVADYLARGLGETKLVEVLDARAAQAGATAAHAGGVAGARGVARTLDAGSVVWGEYSRRGDSLLLEAQLTDVATGKPIGASILAAGPAIRQTELVEALRQRVMATVAVWMDPRFAMYQTAGASHPTNYEAYQEFVAGDQIAWSPCAAAEDDCVHRKLVHYRRALVLDSNFTLPLVWIAVIAWANGRDCARTDSIADRLRPRHDRLPSYDRTLLDWIVARCHGQRAKALEAKRQAMLAAPRSEEMVLRYAAEARHNGGLRESIALTEKLERGRNEQNTGYWANMIVPYHLLGQHQRELGLAEQARRALPAQMQVRMWEAYALVGLGRLADVRARVDEMVGLPQAVGQPVWALSGWLDAVGRDLRAHGYGQEAQAVFERGIRWVHTRSPDEQRELRTELAELLYDADRWAEARPIVKQVAAEAPDDIDQQAWLGAVAARLGDVREVARIDRWLAAQKRPYLNGKNTFNRARLAAILGERDRAVELYRQAVAEGFGFNSGYGIHSDPDFESVRGYPPFEALPSRF